jgi:hypothetical protein
MIKITIFLIVLAAIHAKLELMIEGRKVGWAHNLPCWRVDNVLTHFLIGKEITGYHWYLCMMFLLLFHSPFLFISWSLKQEFTCFGYYFIYWLMEDILWFIENPYYSLRNFKKGRISWHKRWFWGLPVSYWWGMIIGTVLLIIGGK